MGQLHPLLYRVQLAPLAAAAEVRKIVMGWLVALVAEAVAGVVPVQVAQAHLGKEILEGTLQMQDLHGVLLAQEVVVKAQQAETLQAQALLVLVGLVLLGLTVFTTLEAGVAEVVLVVVILSPGRLVAMEGEAREEM
jgi:hypothetical protein